MYLCDTKEYILIKWRVILEPGLETDEWVIWCPELPACASAGETPSSCIRKYTRSYRTLSETLINAFPYIFHQCEKPGF